MPRPEPDEDDRWLNTAEAMRRLSVSRWTLDKYAKAGRLHPMRLGGVGGELRWHLPELLRLLEHDANPDASYRGGGPRGRGPGRRGPRPPHPRPDAAAEGR